MSCRHAILALAGAEPLGAESAALPCACVNHTWQFTLQNSNELLAAELVLGFAPVIVFAENGFLLDKPEYRFANAPDGALRANMCRRQAAFKEEGEQEQSLLLNRNWKHLYTGLLLHFENIDALA